MNKPRDPNRTKTGKTRLGPLNLSQLEKLLESARKKNKPQILRRIALLQGRNKVLSVDTQGESNAS